jgi:hypothetical protein
MMRTPAEVSCRFADAINAGDLESALACWAVRAGSWLAWSGALLRWLSYLRRGEGDCAGVMEQKLA